MFCKNCGSQVPDGIAFCAVCGTPVAGAGAAPAAPATPAAPAAKGFKLDKDLLIKVVAGVAALALLVLLFAAVFGGGAKSVAKKYVKAEIEGDIKKAYSLMAGKAQKYIEEVTYEDEDDRDDAFEWMEELCDEEDIDVKIEKFSQYYKANKKLTKAVDNEYYGKGYKVEIDVREVIDMKDKVIKAYQELADDDTCEEYIKAKKIKKGKFVVVKVYIDGDKESKSYDTVVPVVKYGGSWKVIEDIYTDHEDYEWDKDKYEALSVIAAAMAKAEGEDVDEEDYDYDYDYDYEEDYDYDYDYDYDEEYYY